MLFKTFLMVNPLQKKHLQKLPNIKNCYFILNLEDGIQKEQKSDALNNIAIFLKENPTIAKRVVVRVNPFFEGGKEEIEFLDKFDFWAIRLSKVKKKKEIKKALKIIKNKEIHLSFETKEIFYKIKKFKISNKVTTLYLGILDLLNSFNLSCDLLKLDNPLIDFIFSKIILDAKSAGFFVVGFVFQDYENLDEFKKWCKKEKNFGFDAKVVIGPKQLEIAKEIFKIDQKEILKAKKIKERFEKEGTFFSKEYGFVDEPIYKDALLLLSSLKENG